jgi:3-methyladenine DNA glycosylase AlkD
MENIIQKIRAELKENGNEERKKSIRKFFKEGLKCYGLKSEEVRKIAKKHRQEIKDCGKEEIFRLCEGLFSSGYLEEAGIAAIWLPELSPVFKPGDLEIFKRWIERYIDNWAKCDTFCNHTVGVFMEEYPEYVKDLKKWAKSGNRWMKRAAAVSLIIPAKKGMFLSDIFEIADLLLTDTDDMVQKGYGWLLKEASRKHQKEVFGYVIKNKDKMPRTSLRYAIELMPRPLKDEAMKKQR